MTILARSGPGNDRGHAAPRQPPGRRDGPRAQGRLGVVPGRAGGAVREGRRRTRGEQKRRVAGHFDWTRAFSSSNQFRTTRSSRGVDGPPFDVPAGAPRIRPSGVRSKAARRHRSRESESTGQRRRLGERESRLRRDRHYRKLIRPRHEQQLLAVARPGRAASRRDAMIANWLTIANRINAIFRDDPKVAGVVVTHGTIRSKRRLLPESDGEV